LNFRDRKGIATSVIAVIIVLVIAVGAAGAYFAFSSGGSSTGSTSNTSSSSTPGTSTTGVQTTTSRTSSSAGATTSTTSTPATSSSSSTSSTVSSSTSYSTLSCASTYSTTTGTPPDYTPQYINLIQQFSSIEFKVSESNGTLTNNETLSYLVTSASGGIYNVNMSFVSTSSTTVTFVVDSNNDTVLSVSFSGQPLPKSYAKEEFDALMGVFGLQQSLGNQLAIFTDSAYFHSTGTSSMTFGAATFPVTTYVANSLPESFTSCGVTSNITAYTLQVGTPTGTSLLFITYLHFEGTSSSFSGTDNVTFQLVSMTVG